MKKCYIHILLHVHFQFTLYLASSYGGRRCRSMNENQYTNRTMPRIAGLSTLVCLDDLTECFHKGLVSSSGKVVGPPESRLAGIIGMQTNEKIPASWLRLHHRANPCPQEV